MATDADLLEEELLIQQEADEVEHDLALPSLLGILGTPVRVGSSALGVMVNRDLDVTVICSDLQVPKVVELGALLALHRRVRVVTFRNDTGGWNADPMYPDGLYLGIKYAAGAEEWNVDIWFVDEPHRQPDLQDLKSLLPRIDEPARSAILRIKHDLVGTPRYGTTINGLDIYTAVLDGSVRDTQSFESWLRER